MTLKFGANMADKKNQFEVNLEKLEDVVKTLESGQLGLEESIEKYEQGIKLYKDCKKTLDTIEKKISVLSESLEIKEEM